MVVKKGKRKLHLYRDCRLVKTFPIDLGENPKGPKLYQGDMRTPEGLYRVIEKKIGDRPNIIWPCSWIIPMNRTGRGMSWRSGKGKFPPRPGSVG